MKNNKIIFIAGFIVGSLSFGFSSQYIAEYYYNKPPKKEVEFKYNSMTNWEDDKKNDGSKPWD